MPTYDHEIPARKMRITVTHEFIGAVDGWDARMAKIEKILRKLADHHNPEVEGAIPVSFAVGGIARDMAMTWEAPPHVAPNRKVVAQTQKIQSLAKWLIDQHLMTMNTCGISHQLQAAIAAAAKAELFKPGATPKSVEF
jgi:hypothetical protein